VDFAAFLESEDFVLRNYADMVYKVALRNTQSPADAEDVFTETFLSYYSKKPEFESEEHRKAWLLRVAINFAHNSYRAQKKIAELDENIAADEDAFGRVELCSDLKDALKKMRPEYREVICLFYLQELSTGEIASVLGRNESTVRTQLSRAREQLRGFLE
jgi:RNA polymerase sigma-70 factor, ECF subfamily